MRLFHASNDCHGRILNFGSRIPFVLPVLFVLLTACQPANVQPILPTPSATATPSPLPPTSLPLPVTPTPNVSSTPTPSLTPSATATEPPLTTLLFTGVIVPARCVQAALDRIGNPDYPYEEVREVISQADLAVGVFNATMSDRVEHTGCTYTYQLVGSPDNADAAQRAGFDLMNVATNHIKDCGLMKSWCDDVFLETLQNFQRVGILTVGAGEDLGAALQPVVVTINGVRFGFVALGDSKQSELVFAAQDRPGIASLTDENIKSALQAVREVSDVVIAMPHWGSEDIFIPNWIQRKQAQQLVAAGADLVVGNHTHVVQGKQEINGVPVFYGLGNFVFDQGLRDHRQGVILLVTFEGKQLVGYKFIPTHVDPDGRVHIASPEEAAEILANIEQASRGLR